MSFLYGRRWERQIVAYPATTVYCTQLRDAAVREVGRFVAHHYARHVEDLAAGPDLSPAVATTYGLQHAGRRFLRPDDTDLWRYRDRYHRLLDTAPWSPARTDVIMAHVPEVHRVYLDVMTQLSRCWP